MTQTALDLDIVRDVIEAKKGMPGALLPILHAIQEQIGFIPKESVGLIAKALNLSRAEVHGVITFYHYFRTQPPGLHTIYLCRAESCQAMSCEGLEAHVKARLGIDYHQTTPDGVFSLEPVYCLGNCACSPSLMVGREVYGRVTPQSFDAMLDELRGSVA
jgi:formate dehydrogenase subunit gamma